MEKIEWKLKKLKKTIRQNKEEERKETSLPLKYSITKELEDCGEFRITTSATNLKFSPTFN